MGSDIPYPDPDPPYPYPCTPGVSKTLVQHYGFCEGSVPIFVTVREEVTFLWGVVDLEVMG